MGDDTRELLNAHHAAILRELDLLQKDIRGGMGELKVEISSARSRLDQHTADDAAQFASVSRGISVLQWAYGVGVAIIGALLAKIGWTS